MENNLFGQNLRLLRITAEKSQDELSKILGVQCSTISYWEAGKTEPNLDMLKKIAKLFDVLIDNLLEEI